MFKARLNKRIQKKVMGEITVNVNNFIGTLTKLRVINFIIQTIT